MFKKVTNWLLASTMIVNALPATADQSCNFSRTMEYQNKPVYDQLKNLSQVEIHLMFETNGLLFRRAKSGEPLFELAQSLTFDEKSQTLRIKMRENCGWSDGNRVTAHDVVKGITDTFVAGRDLYIPGRNFFKGGTEVMTGENDLSKLKINATSENEIEIQSLTGYDLIEQALTRINFSPYPSHLSPDEQLEWRNGNLSRISSGAYQIKKIDDFEILMERNPHFCTDIQPEIQTIKIIHSSKSASQLGMFQSGIVNVTERFASRDLASFQAFADAKQSKEYIIREMNDEIMEYLMEEKGSKLENEPHLRPALLMALDTVSLSKVIENADTGSREVPSISYPYEGYAKPEDPLLSADYSDRLKIAKGIMEKAGYNDQNKFSISLKVSEGFNDSQVANAIAAMWSQIGVETKKIRVSNRNTSKQKPEHIDYSIFIIGSDYSDPSDFLNTVLDYANFSDAEQIRKSIEDSFDISDQDERWKELSKIDSEMLEQRVLLPINVLTTPWILSNDLDLKNYFNLYASNLSSSSCPSQ